MVSGFVTSPHDHHVFIPASSTRSRSFGSFGPRISSGEAMRTCMKSNAEARASRTLRKSIIGYSSPPVRRAPPLPSPPFPPGLNPSPPIHVVGFDSQDLLEGVRRAVRLERPHLHLAEPLAAELRLAGERLLGDERVRARAPRVDLVVHEVE